jgi:uncharacterized protein (DUF2141 family)
MVEFIFILFTHLLTWQEKPHVQLTIQAEGVKHDKGILRACLFSSKEQYLGKSDLCAELLPKKGTNTVELIVSKSKKYALVVYHDENGNGRIDLGALRIPVEPYGFIGNPSTWFGPPSFDKASFSIAKDSTIYIKL